MLQTSFPRGSSKKNTPCGPRKRALLTGSLSGPHTASFAGDHGTQQSIREMGQVPQTNLALSTPAVRKVEPFAVAEKSRIPMSHPSCRLCSHRPPGGHRSRPRYSCVAIQRRIGGEGVRYRLSRSGIESLQQRCALNFLESRSTIG